MRQCKRCDKEFELGTLGTTHLYCSKYCARYANIRKHIELRKSNPEYKKQIRELYFKRAYGISSSIKDELLEKQNNCCAICENLPINPKNLHLDHCHATNKLRGVLCSKCNQALGLFNDSTALLKKAITYLDES